jgi:hypothetical protein
MPAVDWLDEAGLNGILELATLPPLFETKGDALRRVIDLALADMARRTAIDWPTLPRASRGLA